MYYNTNTYHTCARAGAQSHTAWNDVCVCNMSATAQRSTSLHTGFVIYWYIELTGTGGTKDGTRRYRDAVTQG